MPKQEAGESGFTDAELEGLSDEEREAIEGDDDEVASLEEIAAGNDDDTVAGGNADDDVDDEADDGAKTKAEAAAQAKEEAAEKARLAAEEKAAAEATKKRTAELAAMSEEERKKAAEADRAKADAAAKAKTDAEAKAKDEAEQKKRDEAARAAADAEGDEPLIVVYDAKPPEKYDEQVKALDARRADATAKYKDGKLELEDMLAEHAKVDGERRDLEALKLKAEISAQQNEQAGQRRWQWDINRFTRNTARHEGIDYRIYDGCPAENRHLNAMWDAEVKALANKAENADKPGDWFLRTAHENVKRAMKLGKQPETAAEKTAREEAEKKTAAEAKKKSEAAAIEQAKRARENKGKLPKTLGELPAAGGTDAVSDNEGEFAHLDGLNGMELEVEVAKLTPAQQDRYARAD